MLRMITIRCSSNNKNSGHSAARYHLSASAVNAGIATNIHSCFLVTGNEMTFWHMPHRSSRHPKLTGVRHADSCGKWKTHSFANWNKFVLIYLFQWLWNKCIGTHFDRNRFLIHSNRCNWSLKVNSEKIKTKKKGHNHNRTLLRIQSKEQRTTKISHINLLFQQMA